MLRVDPGEDVVSIDQLVEVGVVELGSSRPVTTVQPGSARSELLGDPRGGRGWSPVIMITLTPPRWALRDRIGRLGARRIGDPDDTEQDRQLPTPASDGSRLAIGTGR